MFSDNLLAIDFFEDNPSLMESASQRCPGLLVHHHAEKDFEGMDCLPGRIEVEAIFRFLP